MNRRCSILIICVLVPLFALAISAGAQTFIPNAGQWNERVLYKTDLHSGHAFLCSDGIRFAFFDADKIETLHDSVTSDSVATAEVNRTPVSCYAYELSFQNANVPEAAGIDKLSSTCNYFIGNDPEKWHGNLPMYSGVAYTALYNGINVIFRNKASALKYDFVVAPGADPAQISMLYSGQQFLGFRNGALHIGAGFTIIREVIPAAYQVVNGKQRNVRCEYVLTCNAVSFRFPDGYDATLELIIDPEVIASTYSGGTAMAFGFTATYDESGNIFAGGIVYAQGYPVTLGAFDITFDSLHDIGISKFDPTGTNLLYCTYVGGSLEEYPLSMYEHQGDLYVYGRTKSPDFPVTAGAFDQSYGGQADIVVFALNSNGTALLASTFVGDIGDDGVNYNSQNFTDGFRGEIIVDDAGNVFVASGSTSQAFPVTPGAYCTTYNGGVEAVLFKMNSSLSTMLWATFIGGSLNDSGLSLRVDASGNVYMCGVARNIFGGFPVVAGSYQTTYGGGATDAFLAKFDPTGSSLLACTFFGGAGVDAGYFIDIDTDGDVYMMGNYLGAPITAGVYANPGSENFVAKFDAALSNLLFCTVIGDGTQGGKINPTAFMVDNCKRIYLAGFGGSANLPLTNDALYSTWDFHHQWYLACLSENAGALLFGSLYGSWHVDGGTSRFDKDGVVYQTVCADSAEFPITSWAHADGTNTTLWDICVFKIDFAVERDTLELPNVFTPNNDGINDVYDVGLQTAHFYELRIYDRWGTKIFSSNDLSAKWDGTYGGRECEEGVYYVEVKHGYCGDEPYVNTGFVHLQRSK